MADTVDMAAEYQASEIARGIAAARRPFDPGQPGECAECGDDSPRLVGGRCAPCRDGRRR
ncbi:MAG: conjugal transfer protein TraR [Sphingomonas sp.]|nr:conjugal transfer protein TraR [Sphingomonas sp.]